MVAVFGHPLDYLARRHLQKWLPPGLTWRLASRDQMPVQSLLADARFYREQLESQSMVVHDAHVLEIGPGSANPFSVLLFQSGARRVTLVEPYLRAYPAHLREARLQAFWQATARPGDPPLPPPTQRQVEWKTGSAENLPLQKDSVLGTLSQNMLQFIRDPRIVFDECYRVTQNGGFFLHRIDLRDHVFRHPFEMLTFRQDAWDKLCPLKQGRGWHNRLRPWHWVGFLENAGFHFVKAIPLERDEKGYRQVKDRLCSEFAPPSGWDPTITEMVLIGHKP
jgi:SAM-dependent methyltransferase